MLHNAYGKNLQLGRGGDIRYQYNKQNQPDKHYIEVRGAGGDYTLSTTRLTWSEPPGEDFQFNAATTRYIQPNGDPATGYMEGTGSASQDHFTVPLVAGERYRIELKGKEPSDRGGTLKDPAVSVQDLKGDLLTESSSDIASVSGDQGIQARDQDSGNGNDAKLEIAVNTTGTYLIAAESEEGTGTYTLVVTTY